MQKRLWPPLLLLASACLVLPARAAEKPVSLFVAVDGSDTNPGTKAKPFATLERARDEVRKVKAAGQPVVVTLRGGDYLRTQTLELTKDDSGTPDAPVIWRAEEGERVRLLGGRILTGFQPVTDPAVLALIDEGASKHVVELDLRSLGITSYGQLTSRGRAFDRPVAVAHTELFFDHRPMTLARWPNEGDFTKIAGHPAPEEPNAEFGGLSAGFHYAGDRPRRWQDTSDLWMHGYWVFDWANSYEKVAALDLEQRLIKTAPPYGIYGFRKDQRFYFLNVLEELDQPGEWFLDRKSGILYFWPPASKSDPEILLSLLDQPLLKLTDVSNVTFRGITFEATRANAVEIRGGASDRLVGCTIRNIGNAAVIIEGGAGHGVVGCDILDTGDGGVAMVGGNRQTLAPGGHFVENCHFQRLGRWSKCYVPAIRMEGVGLRASHNLIHDLPHCAIIFLGNDHVIEFNEIHHVAMETGDVGAIYSGDNYSFRGNRVRHNFIHHTGGYGLGSMGVYMDDWVSGTEIFGNVFYKVDKAVFLGGGRDHQVTNNLFVDCDPAVQMDARGLDPSPQWRAGIDVRLGASLAAVPQPLYRERYPELKTLDAYYGPPEGPAITGEAFKGVPPENNSLQRNVCVGKWVDVHWFATLDMLRLESNLTDAASSLAKTPDDQSPAMDFELKKNSPAWALGFQRIPLEQIGLVKDGTRASLPVTVRADDNSCHLFVAVNGDDANPGTKEKPFATLERARDEIRRMKAAGPLPDGGVTVEVAGGIYERSSSFELTDADSGTEKAPIVYRGRMGEEVRLVGGREVTGWEPVLAPAVLERMDPAARGQVLQADLRALGITNYGRMTTGAPAAIEQKVFAPYSAGLELFFNDQPMTLARWPNEGFTKVGDLLGNAPWDFQGLKGDSIGKFTYDGDRPARWVGEKDVMLHGYWAWDWSDQRCKVESIDPASRTIAMEPPYHSCGYRKGQRYYAFNLLPELDAPGEWWLDRDAGILYFWPPSPVASGRAIVSVLPSLVTMRQTVNLTLRNMTLEAAQGTAVTITDAINSRVVGCTIRNVSGWAVRVADGTDNGVAGCDIYATGEGGVGLAGGVRAALTPARNFAVNNHIHHYSRICRSTRPAVELSGVGNRAAHNLIHHAPHQAILYSGNDHIIEFNEIHDVCAETGDAGAIYSWGDWSGRGTVIRHNFLHDIKGPGLWGAMGVYIDGMWSGTTVFGNLFQRVDRAVFISGGRDNVVENNVFVDCNPSVYVDARGLGWAWPGLNKRLKQGLEAVPYQSALWSGRYPQLARILEDEPGAPKGNKIVRNICQGGRFDQIPPAARSYILMQDNLVDADPRFVAPDKGDFQLLPDSPAFNLGFQRIPLEQIGLVKDDSRASWPLKDHGRKSPSAPMNAAPGKPN